MLKLLSDGSVLHGGSDEVPSSAAYQCLCSRAPARSPRPAPLRASPLSHKHSIHRVSVHVNPGPPQPEPHQRLRQGLVTHWFLSSVVDFLMWSRSALDPWHVRDVGEALAPRLSRAALQLLAD